MLYKYFLEPLDIGTGQSSDYLTEYRPMPVEMANMNLVFGACEGNSFGNHYFPSQLLEIR